MLDDIYESAGGLDKATITLVGTENARYCEQLRTKPTKVKNNHLYSNRIEIHSSNFVIHDFQGHKTLNGGRYNLPFNIPIP